jgi:NAD(P)-dependent dehydrogenase (short-subunit alcohol dehydrogenase family)
MSSLFSLDKKIALVTGGAQGLGRMIAAGLIGAGAKVYITSRKREVCEAAARELAQAGACVGLAADLNTPEAVVALANEIKAREPQLHILINNAGRTWGAPLETFPDKAWAGVMAVNVQGPFTLVRELLPLLAAAAVPDDPARRTRMPRAKRRFNIYRECLPRTLPPGTSPSTRSYRAISRRR